MESLFAFPHDETVGLKSTKKSSCVRQKASNETLISDTIIPLLHQLFLFYSKEPYK